MRNKFKNAVVAEGALKGMSFDQNEDGSFVDIRTEMCFYGWQLTETNRKKSLQENLDNEMVDITALAMRTKMSKARLNGKEGWETCTLDRLKDLLLSAAFNDQYIDACNYAGMLYVLTSE